jgi:hypothetical protein
MILAPGTRVWDTVQEEYCTVLPDPHPNGEGWFYVLPDTIADIFPTPDGRPGSSFHDIEVGDRLQVARARAFRKYGETVITR